MLKPRTICPVEKEVASQDQTHTEAQQHAAEAHHQQILIRDGRQRREHLQQHRKQHHGVEATDQEPPAQPLQPQDQKRDVQHHDEQAQRQPAQLAHDHADAHDTAVQDREGHQKFLQREGRNRRPDGQKQKRQDHVGKQIGLLPLLHRESLLTKWFSASIVPHSTMERKWRADGEGVWIEELKAFQIPVYQVV